MILGCRCKANAAVDRESCPIIPATTTKSRSSYADRTASSLMSPGSTLISSKSLATLWRRSAKWSALAFCGEPQQRSHPQKRIRWCTCNQLSAREVGERQVVGDGHWRVTEINVWYNDALR